MLLDLMTAIPPITHGTTMTSLEAVITFWVIIGVVVALAVVAMIVGVVSYRRDVQRQTQMKATERPYEASPQPQGGEQPPVQAPEEEKVLLRR
jgi:NADH:ubiquinone oxidoreductase subunit 3 (subunit A)